MRLSREHCSIRKNRGRFAATDLSKGEFKSCSGRLKQRSVKSQAEGVNEEVTRKGDKVIISND